MVLAWADVRGVFTVAAARMLPEDTPDRPLLILIAFVVAATTLLVQELTVPMVIRRVKTPADDPHSWATTSSSSSGELAFAARDVPDDPHLHRANGEVRHPQILDQVRAGSRIPDANAAQMPRAPPRGGGSAGAVPRRVAGCPSWPPRPNAFWRGEKRGRTTPRH
ncbi:hypothetical protein ACFWIJ_11635 [Streptomyces sp. NPDC127079]|uniref:hypothetical protein n=1 Tax=Streptomyces sp. NPDC127079 TaxID=3347132 RepID=UPI00365DE214